jgi:predicted dehydrogenase
LIRVGIIGCGYWGPNLVRTLSETEGALVARVSDLRPGRCEFIAKRYPWLVTSPQAEAILSDPQIDAVVVATPPDTHVVLAAEALRQGKHVFVEKPLATSVAAAEHLVELAEEMNRTLVVGHLFLYAPAVTSIRSLLRSGDLGTIYYISSTRANLGPPNAQIDVLWDLAPHDLSIILDLMNEAPVEVLAQGGSFTNRKLAETVFLVLRFADGRLAHVHVSWLTPNKTRLMQMVCSQRVVVYDDMEPVQKVQIHNPGIDARVHAGEHDVMALNYGPGGMWAPPLETFEPLREECRDFIESINTGRRPLSDGERGLQVVRVLEAASRSLTDGGHTVLATAPQEPEAAGSVLSV